MIAEVGTLAFAFGAVAGAWAMAGICAAFRPKQPGDEHGRFVKRRAF